MNLQILELPKLIAERRSSAIFGLVIITMVWAGVAVKYFGDVRGDEREAHRDARNFALVFEENVLRSIGEIDKALLYLRRSIETRKNSVSFSAIANTTDVLSDIIVQVAIIDDKGIMRASNSGPQPAPALDLSDREHFKFHLNNIADQLFISKPVVGRASGKWSVQFTRRFVNSDQTFGGVVVASLNPGHLTKFYNNINFGSAAAIALIGSDGVVRSSGGSAVGYALGDDLSGTQLLDQMGAGVETTFENIDPANNETRFVTVRKVKGYPLWVSVSLSKSQIMESSRNALKLNSLVGTVLTLLVLIALEQLLRIDAKARQKANQLDLTLEYMNQGIMLVTYDQQIPIINRRCGELLDLPVEFIQNPPRVDQLAEYETPTGKLTEASVRILGDLVAGELGVSERTMPDGSIIEIRRESLPDGGFVQTFTDVTKRSRAEADAVRLSSEDSLTGLPNRRMFRSMLDQMSRRQPSAVDNGQPAAEFAVLFLDLDRFKAINDTLGHQTGDLLLQEMARRLKNTLGANEVLARLGGDEFAVVVPTVESRPAIADLANSMIEAAQKPFEIGGHRIRSGISVGIAIGPCDGVNCDDLLIAADLALYAVKAQGRGSYRFYHAAMNRELRERRQLEIDLREAIEQNEMELYYQPILNLRSNIITGFEALVRWRHPVNGMVPPTTFIAVAEDTGLIQPLGEWALREACRCAAHWPNNLKIAVNLSPIQFSASNLPEVVRHALAATGLQPHRLELEITEGVFMTNNESTLSTLRQLKQLGVRISLDDFGTGYSSLSYLRSFPFDKIKIDRSFVSDLAGGTEHVVIVQAVVSIARALGMTTLAEGIETVGQYDFLAALDCDEGQGYLFSPPVPIATVPEMIAKWSPGRKFVA
ncbi:EAL domain-containing protein [Bradyrhizobium yuanmingense]|uniref:bifunctional diguanylate cyclase/phosphodiesterase n=1 Tax=Bradyrhizobium yuanmingense TaxID=108015 RepID=UPI001CD32BA4|nr:EAL domain-containing protein [Bradyrhizobium yuanmingense]MCA1524982.1 EAL domain-containing protein [Bradyrhizobium yuanmingense]